MPRHRERHLVVLRLPEDPVAGTRQDHLWLVGPHRRHDDVRARDAPAERGRELPAALPQGRLGEAHHLGRVAVDAHEVRLERRPIERSDEQGVVLSRRKSIDRRLGPLPRLLRLRVHPFAERARGEEVVRLLEPDRRDAERADVILARQSDRPPVPARHVDDLAIHAELLEVPRRPARPLGDGLVGPQHSNGDGKRLRPDVRLKLTIRGRRVDHGIETTLGGDLVATECRKSPTSLP